MSGDIGGLGMVCWMLICKFEVELVVEGCVNNDWKNYFDVLIGGESV